MMKVLVPAKRVTSRSAKARVKADGSGVDQAIPIEASADVHADIEPLAVAKPLAALVKEKVPGLVLAGKQAIDNDMNAT